MIPSKALVGAPPALYNYWSMGDLAHQIKLRTKCTTFISNKTQNDVLKPALFELSTSATLKTTIDDCRPKNKRQRRKRN